MKFKKWLDAIRSRYLLDIEIEEQNSQFIEKIYHFSDTISGGIAFSIAVNNNDEPSIFTTKIFNFKRFNIAEGASCNDILVAADDCLSGALTLKKHSFNRHSLVFECDSNQIQSSKARVLKQDLVKLTQGYPLIGRDN